MGDRANILVKDNNKDNGVYLYTHWDGSAVPAMLQTALLKHWRWDDSSYLTRIIFDVMTTGQHDEETGYGISTLPGDGLDRVLIVDCQSQTVSRNDIIWTFDEYCGLTTSYLDQLWSIT